MAGTLAGYSLRAAMAEIGFRGATRVTPSPTGALGHISIAQTVHIPTVKNLGTYFSKLTELYRDPLFMQTLAYQVRTLYRRAAKKKAHGTSSVWTRIASSIEVVPHSGGLVVLIQHPAGALKEYGGVVTAGQGPGASKSGKWRRGGRAKAIPVPLSVSVGLAKDYGRLAYRMASKDALSTGTVGFLGKGTGDSFKAMFALKRSVRVGADEWMPLPGDVIDVMRRTLDGYNPFKSTRQRI